MTSASLLNRVLFVIRGQEETWDDRVIGFVKDEEYIPIVTDWEVGPQDCHTCFLTSLGVLFLESPGGPVKTQISEPCLQGFKKNKLFKSLFIFILYVWVFACINVCAPCVHYQKRPEEGIDCPGMGV